MKKYEWRSILCILLGFLIFTGSIYCAPKQVSAALFTEKDLHDGEIYGHGYYYEDSPIRFRIEKGVTFQIGNYASFHEGGEFGQQVALSTLSGVKYATDHADIASVTRRGEVRTKKTGTVKIRAEFKKKSMTFILKVVKKGSLTKSGDCKKLKKYVKKLKKAIPKKVNAKNCIDFYVAVQGYQNACKMLKSVNETGRLNKSKSRRETDLAVPEAGWINYATDLRMVYAEEHDGYNKKSRDYIAVSSMTADANTDTITVKLKKKLTKNQLFYLKGYAPSVAPDDGNHKTYTYFRISYLHDLTDNQRYAGIATARLGSREITIQLQNWRDTEREYVKEDVIEGHTYQLDAEYWCPKMEAVAQ